MDWLFFFERQRYCKRVEKPNFHPNKKNFSTKFGNLQK